MRLLITGAAGGIGQAVAATVARAHPGAMIGLVDRDEGGLAAAADRLTALDARCLRVVADLAAVDEPVAAVLVVCLVIS